MCPIRLYQGRLHNNEWNLGNNMDKVKFPVMILTAPLLDANTFTGDIDNAQINPSSILSHLGLRGIGQRNPLSNGVRAFNALSWLAYWDKYKNYYANKQEGIGMVVHNEPLTIINEVKDIKRYPGGNLIPQLPTLALVPIYFGQTIKIETRGTIAQPLEQIIFIMTNMSVS